MKQTRVKTYEIIGTGTRVWVVEEADPDYGWRTHSSGDGAGWYRVRSRRLPLELEALPACTRERADAVRAWQAGLDAECYAEIRRFEDIPEGAIERDGEIMFGPFEGFMTQLTDAWDRRIGTLVESYITR